MSFTSVAQRISRASAITAQPASIPAPVNGWNTRDELDAMDPLDAVTMENFYPASSGVTVRNGSRSYATGIGTGGAVETLTEFNNGSDSVFIAAADGGLYDITTPGAGTLLKAGFSSPRWQTTNFLARLFLANGVDTLQVYDGSTVADSGFTGVTLSTLYGVHQYQQRLFFWAQGSSGFWYAPLNSISGALAFFDLAQFLPRGGSLIGICTITHDGGNGVLDFITFLTSSGDMILYVGNNPADSTEWSMIGRYRISPPVNVRAIAAYGADAFVTTFDDHVPMQQQLVALKVGALAPRSKVSGAVQIAVAANPDGFGWQALYYPKGRRLIFNIPNEDGTFSQHICNTALPSQPWALFTGMNASCWGLFNDTLYYGAADGIVYEADIGSDDAGVAVQATAQQAWNKIDNAQSKRISVVRPIIQSGAGTYTFAIGYDYGALNIPVPSAIAGTPMTGIGTTVMTDGDNVPMTDGGAAIAVSWRVAGGIGTAFSFGLSIRSGGQVSWLRTDYRIEPGTALA